MLEANGSKKKEKINMKVEIMQIEYPEYVTDLFNELTDDKKDRIVKSVIFHNVEEIESNDKYKYEISPFFQKMSNRIKKLPKEEVLAVIDTTESYLIHEIFNHRYPDEYRRLFAKKNKS